MKKLGSLLLALGLFCAPAFSDQIDTKFIKDNAVTAPKILLGNGASLRGRNNANSADIPLLKSDASDRVVLGDVSFPSRIWGNPIDFLSGGEVRILPDGLGAAVPLNFYDNSGTNSVGFK